jgi:hypothetical protein
MSLAREALRLCTVRALRGATAVGNRVKDSEQGPIEDYVEDKSEPEILVFTDDCTVAATEPRQLFAGGKQDLVIEIVATQRMKVRLPDQDQEADALAPIETDAAMEFAIGVLTRQVMVALMDAANPWAELWREFAVTITQMHDRRGSSMRDGVRFAGRQLLLTIQLPGDPRPGVTPGPLWTKFLGLVDATPDLAPIAPTLHALIEGTPVELPAWQVLRAGYGMTLDEARALRLAPPSAAEATSPEFEAMTPATQPVAPGSLP